MRGSYQLYGKGAQRIVVPVHGNRTLKSGLQRDLMQAAELTEADL